MSKVIEIRAMSQEEAVTRALNIAEATPEHIVKVVEKQKSRSFLGLFNKQGIYEIEIDKNQKKVEPKPAPVQEERKPEPKVEVREEKREEKKEKVEKKEFSKPAKKEFRDERPKKKDFNRENRESKEAKAEVKTEKPVERPKVNTEDACAEIEKRASELLNYIGLNLQIEVEHVKDRNYLVELSGEDNGIIIGKKGKTLNSFEYLLNSLMKEYRIEVDVEGFKAKRTATLRDLGKKMAEKALRTGKTVRLNPMPPRERKTIHEVINRYPELDTFSEGRDPKRYIVIKKKR